MAIENQKQKVPPASFYEEPYLPSDGDREEYDNIPLLPVEAHSIIVRMAGKPMSTVDRTTLLRISDDDGECPIDFMEMRKRVLIEFEIDDDWD